MLHHIYPRDVPTNGVSVYGAQVDALLEGTEFAVTSPGRDLWHFELNYASFQELWAADAWRREHPGESYVVTLHDPPVVCGKPFERWIPGRDLASKIVRKLLDLTMGRRVVRRVVRGAAAVIVLNGLAKPVVAQAFGIEPERIRVLPLIPSLPAPAHPVETVTQPVEVLFLGGITPRKGIEDLIHAVAAVGTRATLHLTVFGGARADNPHYLEQLQRLAQQVGAEGLITFTGYGDDAAMAAALDRAAIVVLPYHAADVIHASGPLTTALAYGRAVIASNLPIFADKLSDSTLGLMFPPGNIPALTALLVTLGNNPEQIKRYGAMAYNWMQRHHDPAVIREQLLEVYRSL